MGIFDHVKKQNRRCMMHEEGHEVPDPEPIFANVGIKRPLTIQEQIRQMIKVEASRAAAESGAETFEEADDFEIGDDFDPQSPYEMNFDEGAVPGDFKEEIPDQGKKKKTEDIPEKKQKVEVDKPSDE